MLQFQQKLKHLKNKIKHWNYNSFGNILKAQSDLKKSMKQLQHKIILEG